MNLLDFKMIDAPALTPMVFLDNKTRVRYTWVDFSAASFRGDHSVAAYMLGNPEQIIAQISLREFLWTLQTYEVGAEFSWPGSPDNIYAFDEETEIAFVTNPRSSVGRTLGWYYDGKDVIILLEG